MKRVGEKKKEMRFNLENKLEKCCNKLWVQLFCDLLTSNRVYSSLAVKS